jgi:hypothetical protein
VRDRRTADRSARDESVVVLIGHIGHIDHIDHIDHIGAEPDVHLFADRDPDSDAGGTDAERRVTARGPVEHPGDQGVRGGRPAVPGLDR